MPRTEPRAEKVQTVRDIAEKLARSQAVFLTDYRGLTVAEMNELRRRLRQAGVEYQVAKNTLTRLAAEQVGRTAMLPDLEGPTALAFGYQDPVEAAKVLNDYARQARAFALKGALLGDRRLSAEEVARLAELPAKEQLRAQLVGAIQGPLAGVVGAMNALLATIVYAIDQRARQLEGAAA